MSKIFSVFSIFSENNFSQQIVTSTLTRYFKISYKEKSYPICGYYANSANLGYL